jgi:hypothetical protein
MTIGTREAWTRSNRHLPWSLWEKVINAFKNDGKIEYKKDLDFDDLTSIKHKSESDNAILKSAAAVLTFDIGEEVELELPKRPPKAKREGYR